MSDKDVERYNRAAHAMQSGVKMDLELEPRLGSAKEARVGINSAHVSQAAVVRLLIARGLFTLDEYHAALADEMEIEVRRYEASLSAKLGTNVRLA